MQRLVLIAAYLAVLTVTGCSACAVGSDCGLSRSEELYRAQAEQRRNPSPSAGW